MTNNFDVEKEFAKLHEKYQNTRPLRGESLFETCGFTDLQRTCSYKVNNIFKNDATTAQEPMRNPGRIFNSKPICNPQRQGQRNIMYYLRSKQKHLSMGGMDFVSKENQKNELVAPEKDQSFSIKQYSIDI